jgi:uncharacterized protein YyaL (SSP411 family)
VGPIALGLRLYAEHGDQRMLGIVTKTLDEMARGAIHDQVGGGFHAATVDRAWQIPRLEKPTHVNAQLLMAYLGAYQATRRTRYYDAAEGILAYAARVLSDRARGGFFAQQDAAAQAGDGHAYYTWDRSEVEAALPRPEAEVIVRLFGVTPGGNMPSFPGRTLPHVATGPEALAQDLSRPLSTVQAQIASGRGHLLETRNRRPAPPVDPTLVADRNAMMIVAYFEAFKVLRREDLKTFAVKSLGRALSGLRAEDGSLLHARPEAGAPVPAALADYVWLSKALSQGFQVTGDSRYLASARDLMDRALEALWDPVEGGFFDVPPEPGRPAPSKTYLDRDVPASNAIAALVLDELAELTNVELYRRKAGLLLKAFGGSVTGQDQSAATYGLALDLHLHPPPHAVVIGPLANPRTRALWQAALGAFRPGAIVAAYDPSVNPDDLPPAVSAVMRNTKVRATPQAYVCVTTFCSLPVSDPAVTAKLLATFGREARMPDGRGVTGETRL